MMVNVPVRDWTILKREHSFMIVSDLVENERDGPVIHGRILVVIEE